MERSSESGVIVGLVKYLTSPGRDKSNSEDQDHLKHTEISRTINRQFEKVRSFKMLFKIH